MSNEKSSVIPAVENWPREIHAAAAAEPAGASGCSRAYNLGRRKAAQEETRKRIVEAGAALLVDQGGLAFRMEAVAQAAQVTRQTVYNRFGSRVDLLAAICEEVVDAEAFAGMPAVFQQQDPLVAADLLADVLCRFWQANRSLMRRIRGLMQTEPEFEAMARAHDQRRLGALKGFVATYKPASETDAARLVQALFAITSFEFFHALAGEDAGGENAASEVKQLVRMCIEREQAGRQSSMAAARR